MPRLLLFLLALQLLVACQRTENVYEPSHAPFMQVNSGWADTLVQEMSLEEKIGQLIMFKGNAQKGYDKDSLFYWTERGWIGGLLLNDLTLKDFVGQTDTCKKLSSVPLFIATNQQVLLNNQFSDQLEIPLPASISSNPSDTIRKILDDLMVNQCKALGINFSFSPFVDRFENDSSFFNPQIYEFDWEENLVNTAEKLRLLQDSKILSRDRKSVV